MRLYEVPPCSLVAAFMLVAVTSVAGAQIAPVVEIDWGYAPLIDAATSLNTTVDRPRMNGWDVAVALHGRGRWSVVGEIDAAYGRLNAASAWGTENRWRDFNMLGGVRYSLNRGGAVVPTVQFLLGSFSTRLAYVRNGLEQDVATQSMVLQPGAGMNLMFTQRVGLRLAADLKMLPNFDWVDEDSGRTMARMTVGGVVTFGGR